jgi:hypothetical protein
VWRLKKIGHIYFPHFFKFLFLLIPLLTAQAQTSSANSKFKTLNATILWTGDFSGVYEFTGSFDQMIKGEASLSDLGQKTDKKNPENCEVSAQFSEVVTKFKEKIEPAYKIFFQFFCRIDGKTRTTQSPAFFIRSENLIGPTNRIHISEKTRTTQFFIKEISSSKSTLNP